MPMESATIKASAMGIDIYADEIFDANQKQHQAAFDEAATKREEASDEAVRDRLREKVSEAYDAMFAVGYLREKDHGGPYVHQVSSAPSLRGRGARGGDPRCGVARTAPGRRRAGDLSRSRCLR